jgi:hypothetical protein
MGEFAEGNEAENRIMESAFQGGQDWGTGTKDRVRDASIKTACRKGGESGRGGSDAS